jgi:hypothetical protein
MHPESQGPGSHGRDDVRVADAIREREDDGQLLAGADAVLGLRVQRREDPIFLEIFDAPARKARRLAPVLEADARTAADRDQAGDQAARIFDEE